MSSPAEGLEDLVAHARAAHVVVIGGGIGGLVAALACAKVGIRVTVLEASDRLGGAIHTIELDGMPVDLGAEGYATRGGAVRALVDELGLSEAVVPTGPRAVWVAGVPGVPGGAAPLPVENVRGIPQNPWDERVRRVIGWKGAWRAYLDRLRPPLTIGHERNLGTLVRTRMGSLVLDRLVAPLSLGAFAIHPDDVDIEVAAPGLSGALTRTGSLAGAVAQLRAGSGPPAGLEGIDGGMSRVVEALRDRLREFDARIVLDARVEGLDAGDGGQWRVRAAGPDAAEPASTDDARVTADIDPADMVIIATGGEEGHRLLHPVVAGIAPFEGTALEFVTLVVASSALTAAPTRTEVYPIAGTARAAAITDTTARWPWVRRGAGADVHVLKVTFGGPGQPPHTAALDDADAAKEALAAASALLNVPLDALQLRGSHRIRCTQPPPVSALGHREATDAARAAINAVPGLAIVGATVAGTGLAQVVPDALAEADRVRRTVLWGSADSPV